MPIQIEFDEDFTKQAQQTTLNETLLQQDLQQSCLDESKIQLQ